MQKPLLLLCIILFYTCCRAQQTGDVDKATVFLGLKMGMSTDAVRLKFNLGEPDSTTGDGSIIYKIAETPLKLNDCRVSYAKVIFFHDELTAIGLYINKTDIECIRSYMHSSYGTKYKKEHDDGAEQWTGQTYTVMYLPATETRTYVLTMVSTVLYKKMFGAE